MKDYLIYENQRNKENHKLYSAILKTAFTPKETLIAHHLCFEMSEDVNEEIPSADTMIFDHDVARAIFGEERFHEALTKLALTPTKERDEMLKELLNCYGKLKPQA